MLEPRRFYDDFTVIGDIANGTSIIIDRLTGLEVQPAEPGQDPNDLLLTDQDSWNFAIALAEFVHECRPEYRTGQCVLAAKRWFTGADPDRNDIAACKEVLGNISFTAGWLGVKVGDSTAAAVMACFALTHTSPREVAQRVMRNSQLMHLLRDHNKLPSFRAAQDEFMARFFGSESNEFRKRLVERWTTESDTELVWLKDDES
jgi:hypothetical protein